MVWEHCSLYPSLAKKNLIWRERGTWACLKLNLPPSNNNWRAKGYIIDVLWEGTIALISHTSKVMLKILQARLQQYMNRELPYVQAGFRKGRGTRDQIANIHWIIEKAREFQKNIISALSTMPKPLTVWITRNCGKFWKRWEYQTTWPASWETCMHVRNQQLKLNMEQ